MEGPVMAELEALAWDMMHEVLVFVFPTGKIATEIV
jgi:hypothetical protein